MIYYTKLLSGFTLNNENIFFLFLLYLFDFEISSKLWRTGENSFQHTQRHNHQNIDELKNCTLISQSTLKLSVIHFGEGSQLLSIADNILMSILSTRLKRGHSMNCEKSKISSEIIFFSSSLYRNRIVWRETKHQINAVEWNWEKQRKNIVKLDCVVGVRTQKLSNCENN